MLIILLEYDLYWFSVYTDMKLYVCNLFLWHQEKTRFSEQNAIKKCDSNYVNDKKKLNEDQEIVIILYIISI